MKKLFCLSATVLLCLQIVLTTAAAYDAPSERIDYDDGSYAIVSIVHTTWTRSNLGSSKDYTYYNSDDQRCFSYTLYASFTYDGVTSEAETVDFDITIYRREWNMSTHSEWTSGNTAYGRAVFSGPGGLSIPVNLTLTCDKDGNVR